MERQQLGFCGAIGESVCRRRVSRRSRHSLRRPTWESNNSGKVVASRLEGCTPDPTAIPWLLLQKVSTEGPGIFDRVTYIQRVNTSGGLAPSDPGHFVGEQVEVPYAAQYYFYRATH